MDIRPQDIINSLYNADDILNLRVFDDKKSGIFTGQKISIEVGKYATVEATLKEHNAQGHGIFFVVNTGGQKDAEITRINAQFVESDTLSFSQMQERIDAFPLQPSMIIKTRKSLHTYWFIKDGEVSEFRGIQKQLVEYFDGDPACINESRVMRLPGFYHCKEEPILVECISFHPERRYTQTQLKEALPEQNNSPIEQKHGTEKGLETVLYSCDFIKHCRENAAFLSEHDWYAMITNLTPFSGGAELIHELSTPYPGYNKNETAKKINHFIESGTKPMMCMTIAEKGFRCPKLENGKCKCKSPAALCYQPMSSDCLKELIASLPVSDDFMDNIKTAQDFVSTYLYNQDVATAEIVIGYQLKDKFKFRSSDLKPLSLLYRQCYKTYQTGLKIRRSKVEDTDIPPWYEETKRGLKFLPGILAEHMAKNENVMYAAEQHHIYRSGVYLEMSEMEAQRLVQKNMLPSETKMSQIVDAEHQWRLHIQRDLRELNPNPFIINLKNGLYNVLEDTLSEHHSDYYSTVQLNVNYDKNATCHRFIEFLKQVTGGDMDQVALIQEILGYFLIPINSAQKCFVIVGAAGAGKSVLLRVLNEILLGRQNVSNVSWQALNERFKTAELFGKLANIFADLPTKYIDDNGIFKALVGEDYLTVEKKNRNPFSFQSTARLLFSCNSIPKNYGDRSEGFYRRLIILRFNNPVSQDKRDPNLIDKLYIEADGIFLFALEGLKRLMKNHYVFSETDVNRNELQQYREDSDSVLSFAREYCCIDENSSEGSTTLFNTYKSYCEECGMKAYSQRTFIQQLTASFPSLERGVDSLGKRRIIKGIKLNEILG